MPVDDSNQLQVPGSTRYSFSVKLLRKTLINSVRMPLGLVTQYDKPPAGSGAGEKECEVDRERVKVGGGGGVRKRVSGKSVFGYGLLTPRKQCDGASP